MFIDNLRQIQRTNMLCKYSYYVGIYIEIDYFMVKLYISSCKFLHMYIKKEFSGTHHEITYIKRFEQLLFISIQWWNIVLILAL